MDYLGFCFKKTTDRFKNSHLFYLAIGLYRKNVLGQTGIYDPDFTIFWEDTDLSWRLWLAGYLIVPSLKAIIFHQVSSSAKRLPSEFSSFHARKNRLCGLIKNYSLPYLALFLPFTLTAYLILALIETIKFHNLNSAKASMKAIFVNLTHLSQTLKKRRFIQTKLRRIPDSQILKLLQYPHFVNFINQKWQ